MYVVYQIKVPERQKKRIWRGQITKYATKGNFPWCPKPQTLKFTRVLWMFFFFSNVNTIKIFALDNHLWNFRTLRTQKNCWKLPKRKTTIQTGNDALQTQGAPWHSLRLYPKVRKCLQELDSTLVLNNTKYWVTEVNISILWYSKKYIWSLSLVHSTELLNYNFLRDRCVFCYSWLILLNTPEFMLLNLMSFQVCEGIHMLRVLHPSSIRTEAPALKSPLDLTYVPLHLAIYEYLL